LNIEDRLLFAEHGIHLDENCVLTPALESELRKLRRKIKNKLSAKDCRRRRKAYVCDLEDKHDDLNTQVAMLRQQNAQLLQRLELMQHQNPQPQQQQQQQQQQLSQQLHVSSDSTNNICVRLPGTSRDKKRACVLFMMMLMIGKAMLK
jgi:septal ring factor EnvC (AmiA/AmiB activator)